MPPGYVKAYFKRNKNDAADAEAICEAIGRPTMRFVPVKTADQQAAVLLHMRVSGRKSRIFRRCANEELTVMATRRGTGTKRLGVVRRQSQRFRDLANVNNGAIIECAPPGTGALTAKLA